jgi:hypothetical protein
MHESFVPILIHWLGLIYHLIFNSPFRHIENPTVKRLTIWLEGSVWLCCGPAMILGDGNPVVYGLAVAVFSSLLIGYVIEKTPGELFVRWLFKGWEA